MKEDATITNRNKQQNTQTAKQTNSKQTAKTKQNTNTKTQTQTKNKPNQKHHHTTPIYLMPLSSGRHSCSKDDHEGHNNKAAHHSLSLDGDTHTQRRVEKM